ncbi:unnamed protein product [Rotaria sordida]|uniref:Uncharacterized protein n=1 Tax=Rotaria sordida TaxID=392033 RepID=A0A814KPZ5_9BILA|nr:unnamed protein product [Rotaria sordida]
MEEDFSTREGNQFIDDDDDDRIMDDSTATTILTTTINKTNIATSSTVPKEKNNVVVKRDVIISVRKGEFETGFERGGKTCEHAMLIKTAAWYSEPTVIEYLDNIPSFNRSIDGPLRIPIEMGTIVMGKIASECCGVGDRCVIMPNRTRVQVTHIYYEDIETDSCVCGENVRLKLKNVEEEVYFFY